MDLLRLVFSPSLSPVHQCFFPHGNNIIPGVLYLGYFNGPCEGIIIACTIMGFAAAYGPGFYHQRAIDAIGWPITDESIMMYDLFVWMCLIALFTIQVPSWSSIPPSRLSFADEQCVQRIRREEKPWANVTSNSTSIGPHYTFLCSTLRLVTQSIFSRPREWKSNARRSHNDLCLWQNDHQNHPRISPPFLPLTTGTSHKTTFPVFHKFDNTSRSSCYCTQSPHIHTNVTSPVVFGGPC